MNEIIVLEQKPIITYERIKEVSEQVQQRIRDLDLEKQVVTEDSIQSAKKTRAELNKEFEFFEKQRKAIKEEVAKPYQEFDVQYKEFIAKYYQEADNTLKVKITAFENQLKTDKENEVKEYFAELCQSKEIDFLNLSRVGLKITLSSSLKSLKDQINKFVDAVCKDLDTLKYIPESDDFKNQVLFEYKQTLNMSHSLKLVQERQQALKEAEERRQQAEEEAKRRAELQAQQPIQKPIAEVLQAPIVEKQPQLQELHELQFRVKGTLEQLKVLKQFIINNNIQILE